jgi:hypothetical protein
MVYHGFWITHIDALCHVGWDGELYNGRSFADSLSVAGATWCPIDPLFDGITTRGVLLDVAAGRKEGYVTVGKPVTPQELDETARRQGVRVEPGDVVVVRSGDECSAGASRPGAARLAIPGSTWRLSGPREGHRGDLVGHDGQRPIGYAGFGMGVHLAIPFLGLALVDNRTPSAWPPRARRWAATVPDQRPLRLVGSTGAPAFAAGDLLANSASLAQGLFRPRTPVTTVRHATVVALLAPLRWQRWLFLHVLRPANAQVSTSPVATCSGAPCAAGVFRAE